MPPLKGQKRALPPGRAGEGMNRMDLCQKVDHCGHEGELGGDTSVLPPDCAVKVA